MLGKSTITPYASLPFENDVARKVSRSATAYQRRQVHTRVKRAASSRVALSLEERVEPAQLERARGDEAGQRGKR